MLLRRAFAFLLAAFAAFAAASFANTQFNLARLTGLGVEIPAHVRLEATLADFSGLAAGFAPLVAGALLTGFLAASLVRRIVPVPPVIAYALAGAASIATVLLALNAYFYGLTVLASTRSEAGFAAQCLAGALGGLFYAALKPRTVPPTTG